MKKGCKVYKKTTKSSYISTKNFLVAKNLIDKYLNIKKINEFRIEITKLTTHAKEKYGVDSGRLFTERTISSADKSFYQAVPNTNAFKAIDTSIPIELKKPEVGLSSYYTEGIPGELKLDQVTMDNTRANEILQKMADQFASQTNVPYSIVSLKDVNSIDPNWNKQPGFFKDGVVYFVAELFHTSVVFHEFSHPVMRSLAKTNPRLFQKLYSDLEATPEGKEIIQGLRDNYAAHIKEGTDLFKEEALVFSMQRAAQNKHKELQNSTPFEKFIKNLMYAIKQSFRKLFGKIKIEGLQPDTTIEDLAEMLAYGGNFNINSQIISDKDVAYYQEEIKEELETLKNLEVNDLQSMISDLKYRASQMFYDISNEEDKGKYEDLLKAITDSTGANELEQVVNILKNYSVNPKKEYDWKKKIAELQADVDLVLQHSEAFVNGLRKLEYTSNDLVKHLDTLLKQPNNKDSLSKVMMYEKHIDYFINYLSNEHDKTSIVSILNKSNTSSDNKLFALATGIANTLKQGKKKIAKMKYNATIELATGILSPMKAWTTEYYDDLIAKLEKLGATKEVAKMKDEKIKMLQPLENMEDTLEGYLGSGGMFNNFVENFIYSQDPIVESLGKYLTDAYIDIGVESQRKANAFMKVVFPLVEEAGINHNDLGSIGLLVGNKDKIYNEEDPSKPIEVWTIKSEFKDTRYYIAEYEDKIKRLQEEAEKTNDYSKVIEMQIEMENHIAMYMQRKYKPEFYERFALFQDDIGIEALKQLKNWKRKMSLFNDRYDASFELPSDIQQNIYDALTEEYRFMHSMFTVDNGIFKKKSERDQKIATRLREYKAQSKKFYYPVEKPGLFENKLIEYENSLLSKCERDSEQFKISRAAWIEKNTHKKLNDTWDALVKRAYSRLAELSKKMPASPEFDKLHAEITDICNLNRDEAGIVDGIDMSNKMMEKVKENQEAMNLLRKSVNKFAGLDKDDKDEFFGLIEFLEEYSVKKPTDYYLSAFNNILKVQDDSIKQIFKNSMDDIMLNRENANRFLSNKKLVKIVVGKDPAFQNWFYKNHIVKTSKKKGGEEESKWVRLRPWDMTLPTSDEYYEKTTLKSGEVINGIPARKYYTTKVLGDPKLGTGYFTKPEIGVTTTNRKRRNGDWEWLPKRIEDGAPENSPYINKDYYKLASSDPSSKEGKIFKLLQGLRTEYLKVQERKTNDIKMWLDFPMWEKSNLEVVSTAMKKGDLLEPLTVWVKEFRANFVSNSDNIDQGFNLTKDMKSISNIVKLDLFDSTVNYRIPMSGIYHMEIDRVSTDLPMSIIRYIASSEMNQTLLKMSPFVRALQDTVNSPESIAKDIIVKNYNNRDILEARNVKGDAVRKEAVNAIVSKYFEGQNVQGFGKDVKWVHGVSNTLFNIASVGFFSLNLPSGLKNNLGLLFQHTLEALSGVRYDLVDMGKGEMWSIETMSEITASVYSRDVKSLNIQIVEITDPENGRLLSQNNFKLGEQSSRTFLKDLFSFSWLVNSRNWLQLQSSLSVLGAIMYHTKVKQTIDGVTKELNFKEIWTLDKDGQIVLREGIDPEWGPKGKKFKEIVNLQHHMNRSFQGSYANIEQPEMYRYLHWKWFMYLKKYFITMFMERFAFKGGTDLLPRYNIATGEVGNGFYITAMKNFIRAVKGTNLNLLMLNDQDKRAFIKMVAEVGMLITMGILYELMFGFDPDDPDKYEKLRQKSGALPTPFSVDDPEHPFHLDGWLSNHALLMMMQVKAENEQFIPLPGFGLDNYDQMLTLRSYALGPTIDSWVKSATDIVNMAQGKDAAYYKRSVGTYNWQQEGHAKVVNNVAKSVGISNTQVNPVLGIQHAVTAIENPRRGG